jgi:hypothetical protein
VKAMTRVVLYFNYLSAFEEKCYCRNTDALSDLLRKAAGRIPMVGQLDDLCVEETGADIVTELAMGRLLSDPMMCRFAQFYLYLMLFEVLKREFEIVAVAGYSAGYWLASVACGLFDPRYFKAVVAPIMMEYRTSNWRSWESDTLSSSFLYHPHFEDLNSVIKEWIATSRFSGKVRVKDDRPPHAIQIAGLRNEVEEIAALAREQFPDLEKYSTKPRRSDGAHINWCDHGWLLERLQAAQPQAPTFPIVGSHGDILSAESWQPSKGAEALFRGVIQPLCMTKLAHTLQTFDLPVLAIGSERVTRFSFHGLSECDRPKYLAVWDGESSPGELPNALTLRSTPDW